jgi:hypothetical protein
LEQRPLAQQTAHPNSFFFRTTNSLNGRTCNPSSSLIFQAVPAHSDREIWYGVPRGIRTDRLTDLARRGRAKSFVFGLGRPADAAKKAPHGAVVVVLWWSWWTGGGRKTARRTPSGRQGCGTTGEANRLWASACQEERRALGSTRHESGLSGFFPSARSTPPTLLEASVNRRRPGGPPGGQDLGCRHDEQHCAQSQSTSVVLSAPTVAHRGLKTLSRGPLTRFLDSRLTGKCATGAFNRQVAMYLAKGTMPVLADTIRAARQRRPLTEGPVFQSKGYYGHRFEESPPSRIRPEH